MILLDTDILVDFFRGHAASRDWLLSQGSQPVAIPGFVAMELYAGCRNRIERQTVQRNLSPYQILWPDDVASTTMIQLFADAHLTHATGILDSLIAATALSHNLPLHTFNQKHFAAFPQLNVVQPYAR